MTGISSHEHTTVHLWDSYNSKYQS